AQALQQLFTPGLAGDAQRPTVGDMDFDIVARFQLQRLDHGGGKADGEAVAPFRDLHGSSVDILSVRSISSESQNQIRKCIVNATAWRGNPAAAFRERRSSPPVPPRCRSRAPAPR